MTTPGEALVAAQMALGKAYAWIPGTEALLSDEIEAALALIRASLTAPSASVGEWQTVPKIPTREMIDAGWAATGAERKRIAPAEQYGDTLAYIAYRAMLAAAPASPSPGKATAEMVKVLRDTIGDLTDERPSEHAAEAALNAALSVRGT